MCLLTSFGATSFGATSFFSPLSAIFFTPSPSFSSSSSSSSRDRRFLIEILFSADTEMLLTSAGWVAFLLSVVGVTGTDVLAGESEAFVGAANDSFKVTDEFEGAVRLKIITY